MGVLAVLIFGLIFGFAFVPAGLLSVWLAVSPMRLVARFPIFLAASLLVAGCFGLLPQGGLALAYLFVMGIAIAFFAMTDPGWRILGAGALMINVAMLGQALLARTFATEWFGWTAISCLFVAATLSLLRLAGLKWVSLADPTFSESIEVVSGRTVDGWLNHLDEQGANRWNLAEIMIHLRSFGLPYHDQKAVAIVYEKSIGRRHAMSAADGATFAIVDLMQWSLVAACGFAFARCFFPTRFSIDQLTLGLAVCVAMSVTTIAVVTSALMLRVPWWRRLIAALLVLGVAVSLQDVATFYPGYRSIWFIGVLSTVGYAFWLTLAMRLAHQRGYRLVQLRRR